MKKKNKALSYIASPFTIGLVVTLLIVAVAYDYYSKRNTITKDDQSLAGLIQLIHGKSLDWRMNDRGLASGSDRVAILAIDEESIGLEGYWPWSRDKIAKLIDRSLMFGAKNISFDIVFSEDANNSARTAIDHLRKVVKNKPELAGITEALTEEEIKADSDRILANTIKASGDQLVMGAFFDTDTVVPPYTELCLDAHFDRTYPAQYWKKEAIPLSVTDTPMAELKVPKELNSHLSGYFMSLEVDAAAKWFDINKDMFERIHDALGESGADLPLEIYPGLSILVINNDIDNAKDLLQQVNPAFSNPEKISALFYKFSTAFERKDLASLKNSVNKEGLEYCLKFFTDRDELLNKDKYIEKWGSTPESLEQFKAYSWETFFSQDVKHDEAQPKEDFKAAIARFKTQTMPIALPQALDWRVDIPLLGEGTRHSGYFNATQDSDGTIRHARLIMRHANTYMPALSLKAFLVDKKYHAVINIDGEKIGNKKERVITSFEIKDAQDKSVMNIPVDSTGNLLINYSGPAKMFPHVSASDIFSDAPMMTVQWQRLDEKTHHWAKTFEQKVNKRDFLKDKLLVAGVTAIGVYDLRVTPFDENYPGVETHANVLSNLLVENARAMGEPVSASAPGFLRVHPAEDKIMLACLLFGGIILSALITYFGSLAGLGFTALALGIIYVLDKFYFFKNGIVITVVFPILLVSGTFVVLTFYKYFTEERKKRELKGTFAKYVSPAIVDEILADPGNIELGGKKMPLTVMFSDVRGFTTISEKLDPRALSDLLNSYLTPMTNLVFEHKGTLDKYMGDAIMSFWGAPINFPDHATHACRCALAMIVKLKELQAEYRAKGLPEIDIGIGLNTGDMSVGNMGSDTVRSYTVMGDAVNLGSRLEGINKQYGTRIIISEFTQAEIKDAFVCREVDWVKVKGKAQPVRIFELMAEGKVSQAAQDLLGHFNHGFRLYHETKFTEAMESFNLALAIDGDDPVSQLYVERCQDYLKDPPPENWDGVFTMTSK